VQAGDSGGPVYNYTGRLRLNAQGIISGDSDDGIDLNFTQMNNVLSTFSAAGPGHGPRGRWGEQPVRTRPW
jgi:hypothetical protein